MSRRRRTSHELAGNREAHRAAATLGAELRRTRHRRRLTLAQLASRVGVGPTRLHELEMGRGATAPLALWFAIGAAVARPFAARFSRDTVAPGEPNDAGHLAAQELVLGHAWGRGRTGLFELSTRGRDGGSVDVGLRDDVHRALILVEIWNRTDDLGAASRSSHRKVAEASDLAAFRGYRVAWCWLLVDTAANRALVRRFPEVLRAQFTGSSLAWVRCLAEGARPPERPGVAWIDPRSGRITPLRLPGRR
ncbi:MAG TPA: helix-turn-helix domain-containing protein [Candidatus Limnocylindrales bacterium]|nr:helix-turn-helix domain-containing protein [Candidatus Limnocylindrales bacterium]